MQPDAPSFRAFFGDAERTLRLDATLIIELERVAGVGIGAFSRRLFAGDYRYGDITTVIRLGLIGGGESPQRAQELVEVYVARRPLAETLPTALAIVEVVMFGEKPAVADEPDFREAAE